MKLFTIQDEAAFDCLQNTGVLRCNPELSDLVQECEFGRAYDWIADEMRKRIDEPPAGVKYPFWAWHSLYGKPAKPDLRRTEFNNYCGEHYIIEYEIPNNQVLLSDEGNWHFVLNDWFLPSDVDNEAIYDAEDKKFETLPQPEQV